MKRFLRITCILFVTLFWALQSLGGSLSSREARMDLERRLQVHQGNYSNQELLAAIKDYDRHDFVREREYLTFLNDCHDLVLELQPGYTEVMFFIGKELQDRKQFQEAYPYLYKTSLQIEQGERPSFLCTFYETMGHSYYFFGRYTQAEEAFQKGLACGDVTKAEQVNMYNTCGLIRSNMGDLKGAEENYRKALTLATEIDHQPWYGVLSGNLGQLYYQQGQYNKAIKYVQTDYSISSEKKQWGSAINALCLLMRLDLRSGDFAAARKKLTTLDSLLTFDESRDVRLSYYRAKTDFLEKTGDYKDALENYKIFRAFQDTLMKERDLVNLTNTEFQIEFERKQAEIKLLQQTKETDSIRIISLWVFLITLAIGAGIIIWQISKRRKREKELLQLKNERIQEDLLRSEEELRSLLDKLMQKNESIAQLNEELEKAQSHNDQSDEEQQQLTDRLQSFTLLTDEDWLEFKRLFEKRFNGFFDFFQSNYDDVTNAEIRLAALIKLDLENLEMSKALGISPDSVRKTNLRLRKKLGIADQKELHRLIHSI